MTATSADGSSSSATFTLAITDFDEFDVTSPVDSDSDANVIPENSVNGTEAQITASSVDADGTNNAVTYSMTGQGCSDGTFVVNPQTGVVTVGDSTQLDYETVQSCDFTIVATSADGSTASTQFTVAISDADDTAPVFTSDSSILVNELSLIHI